MTRKYSNRNFDRGPKQVDPLRAWTYVHCYDAPSTARNYFPVMAPIVQPASEISPRHHRQPFLFSFSSDPHFPSRFWPWQYRCGHCCEMYPPRLELLLKVTYTWMYSLSGSASLLPVPPAHYRTWCWMVGWPEATHHAIPRASTETASKQLNFCATKNLNLPPVSSGNLPFFSPSTQVRGG